MAGLVGVVGRGPAAADSGPGTEAEAAAAVGGGGEAEEAPSSLTGSNMKGGLWSSCNQSLYTWITRRIAPEWLNGKRSA